MITDLAVTGAEDIDGDADDCADSFLVPGSQLVEHSSSSPSGSGEKDQERAVALWILKLKEGCKLTQSVTDEIVRDVSELCSDMISCLKRELFLSLSSAGIDADCVPGLKGLFHDDNNSPFLKPFS